MAVVESSSARGVTTPDGCGITVAYRDHSGVIHLDWPVEQIRAAVDDAEGQVWIDIHDPESNSSKTPETLLRDVFKFHPLAVEDALKETHVPKVDDWGGYLYVVFHSLEYVAATGHVKLHEI